MRFFFNDTATTEIYTLSLHDALPIFRLGHHSHGALPPWARRSAMGRREVDERLSVFDELPRRREPEPRQRQQHWFCIRDRKSTRLNSSHANISYAVFCLKKKNDRQPN